MIEHDEATRRMMLHTAFGALAAVGFASHATDAAESQSAQERAANKVVAGLIAAAATKDANQVVAFVTDDIVFKGLPDSVELTGKQALVNELNQVLSLPMIQKLVFAQRPSRTHAVGGTTGTAVLAWREDYFTANGQQATLPLAAMFWVVGDKVKAWYDFPLAGDFSAGNNTTE